MKFFKPLCLFLITALLASCGSYRGVTIVKRKHNPGYYVNVGNHKSQKLVQKEHKEVVSATKQHASDRTVNNSNSKKESAESTALVMNETATTKTYQKEIQYLASTQNYILPNSIKSHITDNKLTAQKSTTQNISHIAAVKQLLKAKKEAQRAKGSTNTIVLVILSLFPILALIAIFLKDGRQITLNFWVDLILHLTVIGYLIFALLVVLDIVNLA
ncbi:MAG: hypothetical protein IT238_02885 [Bacteroidia bacterium]|nr:hypothetical protein [Bacteroidia bacterium]MCZ2248529.1 hypothetical protein [Bacteroidia bacterium]